MLSDTPPLLTMRGAQLLYEYMQGGLRHVDADDAFVLARHYGLLYQSDSGYITPTRRGRLFLQIMRQHISIQQRYPKLLLLGLPIVRD